MTRRELEYDLTTDDFVAFTEWTLRQRRIGPFRYRWPSRLILVTLVAASITLAVVLARELGRSIPLFVQFLLAVSLVVAAAPRALWWRQIASNVRRKFTKDPFYRKQLSRHRLTLTADGIERGNDSGNSFASWADYDRVEVSDDYMFFYHDADLGYPVPRRAFAGESSFRDFAETAQVCIEAAKARTRYAG